MTINKHFCPFCGVKYQTIADLPGQPEGYVCPVCESIRKEPATRHFAEAVGAGMRPPVRLE